jgi:hypothetical protein
MKIHVKLGMGHIARRFIRYVLLHRFVLSAKETASTRHGKKGTMR